jgi:hypothetical protein
MRVWEKWCNLIAFCISSVRFFVFVRDTPSGFFSSSCGLRQGDPLSLIVFLIVMEALSKMIYAIVSWGPIIRLLSGV